MRRTLSFAFLTALLFGLAPALSAQEITGTWDLTTSSPRGDRTITFTFAQDGNTVTGTALMPMMGRGGPGGPPGGGEPQEIEISDGSFENGTLTFSITMGMGDRSFTQTYVATTVTATTMEGTITGGMRQGEPTPFKGVKKEG